MDPFETCYPNKTLAVKQNEQNINMKMIKWKQALNLNIMLKPIVTYLCLHPSQLPTPHHDWNKIQTVLNFHNFESTWLQNLKIQMTLVWNLLSDFQLFPARIFSAQLWIYWHAIYQIWSKILRKYLHISLIHNVMNLPFHHLESVVQSNLCWKKTVLKTKCIGILGCIPLQNLKNLWNWCTSFWNSHVEKNAYSNYRPHSTAEFRNFWGMP